MKKMKFARISLLLCVLVLTFGLTACTDAVSVNKTKSAAKSQKLQITQELIKDWANDMVTVLDVISDKDLKNYAEQAKGLYDLTGKDYIVNMDNSDNVIGNKVNAATVEFYNGWIKSREELGKLREITSSECKESSNTGTLCTVTVVAEYEQRQCVFEFTIADDDTFSLKSGAINPTYNTAEKVQKAALNTVIGLGTVFVVLIFISFIISLLKYVNLIGKKPAKAADKKDDGVDNAIAQIVSSEEADVTDDLELVAVITAAIAASEGTSSNGLVVRSIRRRF